MPLQSSVRVLKKPLRLDDEVRFLRSWIEKPLHVGAVMPSGRVLARTMAQYVDIRSDGPVIELGPGTGAITNALIARGVDQKRLVLVEYNPSFCALLRDRYPQATVVQGDAYALSDSLWDVLDAPASAIVSGLPLVTKPMLTRLKLIRDAFVAMAPGAPASRFFWGLPVGNKAVAAPPQADPRRFRGDGARRAVRAVHLFGGAADPEVVARRFDRSFRAHLDEPSARPRLGVSQGLTAGAATVPGRPERDRNHVRVENPRHPRLAAHRLAQCEARRRGCAGTGAGRGRGDAHFGRRFSAADL